MTETGEPQVVRGVFGRLWPWLLLAVLVAPAVWHVLDFENDADPEFPGVARPTFSRYPPAAYRLAEPGDTIDRIAIYLASLALVLSLVGRFRTRGARRPWLAALAFSIWAFWYAANPGPTFDGWHGLGWRALFDPSSPAWLRLTLALALLGLAALALYGIRALPGGLAASWNAARARGAEKLLAVTALLVVLRLVNFPDVEPLGYWPRWAFVWGLLAFSLALIRLSLHGASSPARRGLRLATMSLATAGAWYGLVVLGIDLTLYHRPIDRFRALVPGKIFMSAMPTEWGLGVIHDRHHFKTIINLFPEDTPLRSPKLPRELQFAKTHNIRYVGSPAEVSKSNEFLDLTLALAQDPDAWPILVHCHACMDRTPAWAGIYRFVVEGRSLDEILRFIEGHRGYRPKASVTLLYNRVLPRVAPEHYRSDPTAPLLRQCARGTEDPFERQLRAEVEAANREVAVGVGTASGTGSAAGLPNLTPRR